MCAKVFSVLVSKTLSMLLYEPLFCMSLNWSGDDFFMLGDALAMTEANAIRTTSNIFLVI